MAEETGTLPSEEKLDNDEGVFDFKAAVLREDLERVRTIVESGEHVDQPVFPDRRTALMIAAGFGNLAFVRYLIEAGADVDAADRMGRTALFLAALNNVQLDVIQLLVENGAYINASDSERDTPLAWAAKNGRVDVVSFLVGKIVSEIVGESVTCVEYMKKPLLYAVEKDYLDVARVFLDNGADVNALYAGKKTLLMKAVRKNNVDAVQLLVENNADVDARDDCLTTLLMHAVLEGDLETTALLVKHGADIHAVDNKKSTALIYAVEKANFGVVNLLVKCGADINAANCTTKTSLMNASECGDMDIVRLLVENGADIKAADRNKWTPVMFAAANGKMEIVRYLVTSGADATDLENNKVKMLMYAATRGRMDVIRHLLGRNLDVNVADETGKTMLMCAAEGGRMNLVQFLIEGGADVNAVDNDNFTSLLHACLNQHWDIAGFLVKRGADVTVVGIEYGSNALAYAVIHTSAKAVINYTEADSNWYTTAWNSKNAIRFLVEAGADVNVCDTDNRTPLIEAVHQKSIDVVQFFVDNGADVNSSDNKSMTPLIEAVRRESGDVVQFLLNNGADICGVDEEGKSALTHAAALGNLEIIRLLIQSDANINDEDYNDWTPLMHAVQSGSLATVQFLLEVGADVNSVNYDKRTAIFIAISQGHTAIQHLLMKHIPHVHQITGKVLTQMPDNCFIPPFEVKLLEIIRSENVGGNYRAMWLDAEVAVKLFVPQASATTFAHEVAVWHQLRHPNVIKLYGACDVGHHFFICEWATNGSLVEHLTVWVKRRGRRTPWKFLHQAALGLAYLHERKIMHGNLCSNSILVGGDGMVKLANFQVSGSTTIWSRWEQSDVGCWQAPERLRGEAISIASDIYSLGLCVIAAVTGETPWGGCLDIISKMNKESWDATADPAKYGPINDLTPDLAMLASKMCSNEPRSRVSVSAVVRLLKILAVQESTEHRRSKATLELVSDVDEYKDGDLIRLWKKLHDVVSPVAVDRPELGVFREVETLYNRLSAGRRPVTLLEQFYKLTTDCIGAIGFSSHQFRILQLSSTKAQGHSMSAIYRRIETIWNAIDVTKAEEYKKRQEEKRLKLQEVFVSEVSKTLIVLDELETAEARETFVTFLKAEIDSHGSSYSTEQLSVLEKAFLDFNASLKSDAVTVMPKWFLPWYELAFDGVNYLAKGSFGEIYRAKWLESEVIIKQVILSGSNSSDSCEDDSLLGKTVSQSQSTKEKRKEMREMFEHEVNVWFSLSHPHVVRLFGACHVGTPVFVCEFANNGSLDKYLRKYPNEIWRKLHEAALGVQYLHSRDIIHGDLKCNNIVVGGDHKAKVTDFGLSSANVVTGAWQWVAPECLERGPSELSSASDIYALGMCIVEALRIVELTTSNENDYVSLPWGNFENNVVKYHVTREKLPTRPKLCLDDEWRLVELMCAYNPKDRIKVSTVVDKLAALAGVNNVEYPEMAESVKLSPEEVEKVKRCCDLNTPDQRETSSMNQVVLHSVYGLLWDRFQDLCVMPNAEFGCLQRHFDRARLITRQLSQCPNTLPDFTEMVMNGYALHRELDKAIDANFWCVDRTSGGLHDWKSKCTTAVCIPALVSTRQEVTDTERKPKRMRYQ